MRACLGSRAAGCWPSPFSSSPPPSGWSAAARPDHPQRCPKAVGDRERRNLERCRHHHSAIHAKFAERLLLRAARAAASSPAGRRYAPFRRLLRSAITMRSGKERHNQGCTSRRIPRGSPPEAASRSGPRRHGHARRACTRARPPMAAQVPRPDARTPRRHSRNPRRHSSSLAPPLTATRSATCYETPTDRVSLRRHAAVTAGIDGAARPSCCRSSRNRTSRSPPVTSARTWSSSTNCSAYRRRSFGSTPAWPPRPRPGWPTARRSSTPRWSTRSPRGHHHAGHGRSNWLDDSAAR